MTRARARVWLLAWSLCACATQPQPDTTGGDVHVPWPARDQPRDRPGLTREVTPRELSVVQELMDAAERVRGLRFARAVPVLVQDADAIMAYVDSQIEEDELARAQLVYEALGLLPSGLDVRALLLRLMGEQVVGYYDVDAHHLVVRDDVMRAFGGAHKPEGVNVDEARVVLVHELVHALQDQNLGLSVTINAERDTDAENAFRALVEGDATLAMFAFAHGRDAASLSQLTSDPAAVRTLSALVRSSPLAGSELGNAPEIVRAPLLSAYVDGLGFAAHLHGDGGFSRLDRAHADPPLSTEHVLHPERFAHRDQPLQLRFKPAAGLLGAGYELVYEDTLGELELSVYFGLTGKPDAALRSAKGWAGDRLYAYRAAGAGTAIVWLTAWDDAADATEAARTAEQAMHVGARVAAEQRVERCGRAVLLLRAVPTGAQASVVASFAKLAQASQLSTPADCHPAGD